MEWSIIIIIIIRHTASQYSRDVRASNERIGQSRVLTLEDRLEEISPKTVSSSLQ